MNKELVKSLIAVQKEIYNPKNTANNPFFKSKYAPLNEILNLVRPLLTQNGLFLTQNTGTDEISGKVFVQSQLLHVSGEAFSTDKLILTTDKNTPQGLGSAITYGRRYQLSALLGIASEEDDDGNINEVKKTIKPKTVKQRNIPKPPKPVKPKMESLVDINDNGLSSKESEQLKKEVPPLRSVISALETNELAITKDNIVKELGSRKGMDDDLKKSVIARMNKVLGGN